MRTLHSANNILILFFISLALGSNPALAAPPAWAPAHGYYKDKGKGKGKHKNKHQSNYEDTRYKHPPTSSYEVLTCDPSGTTNSDIGTVVGGVIGGILGSKIGKGDGKTLATIAGVIIGSTIGSDIGASMDEADRYCAGQAFVHAQDNQAVEWTNPDTQRQYNVIPRSTYNRNGRYCRDYTSNVAINDRTDQVTGTACKDGNGNWQIIN